MSTEGIDYSAARPGGARLKAEGKHFAVRYLYPPVAGGKGLSAAEVADLHAHGVAVALVFEGTAGGARNGRSQGISDAKRALYCLKALPLHQGLPIYFAVDFDPAAKDWAAIDAYFAGVRSVLGLARTGVYGGYSTVTRLHADKAAAWFWQTYAWSGGRQADFVHLYQHQNGAWGGQVDFTRALRAEYGQNPPAAAKPPTPAAPKPPAPAPAPAPAVPPVVAAPAPTPTTSEDPMPPVYFKGDKAPDVFVLNRLSGHRRHVSHSEWLVAQHGATLVTIPQADADAIPSGA